MKYISIDIETSGLDPDNCQIIEFGAVIDDMETPLEKCPTFRYRVKANHYRGEPYALAMHKEFFEEIGKVDGYAYTGPNDLVGGECGLPSYFARWLQSHGVRPKDFTAAGKNFAEFDAQFIRKLPAFHNWESFKWRHAILDPGPLYVLSTDVKVPDMAECVERAGGLDLYDIPGKPHSAVYDATVVCALLRERLGKFAL